MMGLKTQRASFCRDHSSSTSWGPCAGSTSASNLTFDESGELKLIPSLNTRYYLYFWIPFSYRDGCLRLDCGEKKMNLQRNRDKLRQSVLSLESTPLTGYWIWLKHLIFIFIGPKLASPRPWDGEWVPESPSLSLPSLPVSHRSPSAFCFVFVATGDDWIILFEICKSGRERDILTCWMWKQWSLRGEKQIEPSRGWEKHCQLGAEALYMYIHMYIVRCVPKT